MVLLHLLINSTIIGRSLLLLQVLMSRNSTNLPVLDGSQRQ